MVPPPTQVAGDNGLLLQLARDDLAVYTGLVHRTAAGAAAIPPPHLANQFIPALEDDSLGDTLIIAPPDSAKTFSLIAAAGWWLGRDPTQHVAFISNTATQALKRGVAIRDTVALNPIYRAIFPGTRPDVGKGWSEAEWFVRRPDTGDKDPSMLATGVGGPLLGSRIDRGVLDDIADARNMATLGRRDKVRAWLQDTFTTRLTPDARVVMLCTRWHGQDPAAWAADQGWHVVHVDALTPAGASYWPDRWPLRKLACPPGPDGAPTHRSLGGYCWRETTARGQARRGYCRLWRLGTRRFAQQYRGQIVDDASALVKRHLWRTFSALPVGVSRGGIFVDTAHTESQRADYSVVLVAATDGVNVYILDVRRAQVEYPALEAMVQAAKARWGLPIYIEDTLGGKPLWQRLRREVPGVVPWRIEGRSKLARVEACLPYFEAGNVHVLAGAGWVDPLVEEAAAFPDGAHDDQVDAVTMALLTLLTGPRWGAVR